MSAWTSKIAKARYNGTLERYCRGNYLKRKAKAEARDADE